MSLEEKNTASICQEKIADNASSKTLPDKERSEEFLSPTRRSSRIRKPKVSSDFCNIDEAIEENKTKSKNKDHAKGKSKQPFNTATNNEVNLIDSNKDNELSASHKSAEESSSCFQMDSDGEESFESMFDDIFGHKYSKNFQSLLPKKLSCNSVKERKFFKRNSQDSPESIFSESYSSNKSNLPTDDVDKVFKIISKPNILPDIPSDSRAPSKPSLKTYCNKRKSFQKSNVVESFGLPDYPIIPENEIKPILNNKLDTEILDAKETTIILDLQLINKPWVTTNKEGESLFPFYEEIRIKEEPVKHERLRKNHSFIDPNFIENPDLCNEFSIHTFTQTIISDKKLNKTKCTSLKNPIPRDTKMVSNSKEINIEAIKINFKKILNRNIESMICEEETKEENKVKVKKNITPKKKIISSESKHNFSESNEISFIENDSLTIENKEFEISNVIPSTTEYESKCLKAFKCNNNSSKLISSLHFNKTECEYSNNPADTLVTKDDKIIGKELKSSSSQPFKAEQTVSEKVMTENLKVHHSSRQKTKDCLKSSACKNDVFAENEETFKKDGRGAKSPKKRTRETDFVLSESKHSLSPLLDSEEQQVPQDITQRNDEKEKLIPVKFHESSNSDNEKRMLRSSINSGQDLLILKANHLNESMHQNKINSEKNEIAIMNNSGINHNCTKEELLLNSIIKTQSEKLATLEKNLRSNINLTSKPNLSGAITSNGIITRKRILRSNSQENLLKEIQDCTKLQENNENSAKNMLQTYINEDIKTDVQINLKKLNFETNTPPTKYQESSQASINSQQIVFPTHSNETVKAKRTSIKSVVRNDKNEQLVPEIVLHKCSIESKVPVNYNESMAASNEDITPDLVQKMCSLTKGKKLVPEIRVIISPFDVSLLSKLPQILSKDTTSSSLKRENKSPTKRKLRSTQTIICDANGEKNSFNEIGKECRKSLSKNKVVTKIIDSEIKLPEKGTKVNSTEKKDVNDCQTKPISDIVSESNNPGQILNEYLETEISMNNELNVEQLTSHDEENIFQQNLPKPRTTRKSRGKLNVKTISVDGDKSTEGCIAVNTFYNKVNDSSNNCFEDCIKELEKSDVKNSKLEQNLECCEEQCNTIKNVQKQATLKTSTVKPIKITNIGITEQVFNNSDSKDDSCEMEVLNKTININVGHSSDIDDKNNQELKSNKTHIKKINIISSQNIPICNNLKIDSAKENTCKILVKNNTTTDQIEQKSERTKHAALSGNEQKQKQNKCVDSNLNKDKFTAVNHNHLSFINIEKHTKINEKEEILDQLQTGMASKNEKSKSCTTSNKLVTIEINPCNANNYLIDSNELVHPKTVDSTRKGLIEETKSIRKLNNVSNLEGDLLKEIADKKKLNNLHNTTTVSIISDLTPGGLKSQVNSLNGFARDPSVEINVIDTKLGDDNNTVDKGETGEQINNCVIECESIQGSKVIDNFANGENENNLLTSNEVSASSSSNELNFDTKEEQKLTNSIVNTLGGNIKMPDVSKDMHNVEKMKTEKSNSLINNKSKESKQTQDKPITVVENEPIFSPRLRERKLKLISSQTNSSVLDELQRKTENNQVNKVMSTETIECKKPIENFKQNDNTDSQNVTGSVSSDRVLRSVFNRKLDDFPNDTQTNTDKFKSGRLLVHKRRKSINDLDLLDTKKEEYKERLRRSKSVIANPLYLKKKRNERDDGMITKKNVSAFDHSVTEVKHSGLRSRSRSTVRGSIFYANLKKHEEKLVDKKKPKDIKEKISRGMKEKTNTEENMDNKDTRLEDEKINFEVGNLAWAQIGRHPFWPCLVIDEPETGLHKKEVIYQGKRGRRILYHVRFFGDNGRRAWINKHQMMLYSNRNDFQALSDKKTTEEDDSSAIQRVYIIKPSQLTKWEYAVDEAEHLKLKSVQEKVSFFTDMFTSKAERRQRQLLSDENKSTSEPSSSKRKREEMDVTYEKKVELSSNSINVKSPARKKVKKEIKAGTSGCNKNVANLSKKDKKVANVNQIEDNDHNESLSRLRIRKQIDEISEIDSKTSSDNTTDIALYSMAFQKNLFKRNNLFKGVLRDKVCQYCCEPEAVLKCRGRCNGSYHVECASKLLCGEFIQKMQDKNTSNSFLHETFDENKMPEESVDVKEEDYPKHDESKSELLDDDHVQIISVPSSVYNTPPRKTFPPNFKNMSLAEQIDYKMKEIMKKFESKTFYAESSADSNSEENSLVQPLSKIKHFSRCGSLFPNTSTSDRESKANLAEEKHNQILNENEVVKDELVSDRPSTSHIVEQLVENKNVNKRSRVNSKPIKRKSFIMHVTADSDSLDSPKTNIIIQEANSNNTDESADIVKTVNAKNFKCGFCISDFDPFCFVCNQAVSKRGSSIRQKCSLYQCGRFYHPHCLKMWPQTQWSLIQTTKHKDSDEAVDSFVCPLHVCHTCASDDPRAATSRCSGDKIVKCLKCPSTYHSTNFCVPAGTTILSSTQIICPWHREQTKSCTINTTWCFLCSEGGNLICCETCPTSVHPECLPVNLTDDDRFICEDCESGRLPLYDEIVWVKLGNFRWWPALILFPNEIPDNIMNIKHLAGEFVVKFFGTYDHYWVNRGRSFLFQEGDTGHCNSTKSRVDAAFSKAIEEAAVAHKAKKEFKVSQEAESISSLKPPPYIRIKVNKPVGNVRQLDLDLSSTNACECDPSRPNPCGPDSDCLNRLLLTECSPDVCPAGQRCKNQSFDKREYPPLVPYKTLGRGWGLKTLAPIKKGQFVIEYVGEMIDIEEYQRRIQKMHQQKEENYYFLTIDKDRMLDAGPKGNVARFMNHCCQPNCETQKWTVNGDTRVGLFATEDISADTELTFNYNLECVGKEKKVCRCGAPNCSGFIGVKAKQDMDSKKPKKAIKKKKPQEPVILPPCFICGKKGKVGVCNNKVCNNTYHLRCLKMTEWPEGNKFICPWHNCNICSKRTIRCCVKCVNSFCPSHSEGNVRYDNLLGFVCNNHDPMKAPSDEPIKLKKKKSSVSTDESAVTSTTMDDFEADFDTLPVNKRISRNKRKKKEVVEDLESDNEFEVNKSLTSTPKRSVCSDHDSQDDSTVSSATATDVEDSIIVTRKRGGRPRKIKQTKKKLKINNIENNKSTASSSLKDDNSLRCSSNCDLSSSDNELENR